VEDVDPAPGQPGLCPGDYIVAINGRRLMGLDNEATKQAFGSEFGNGANIDVVNLCALDADAQTRETRALSGGSWPEAEEIEPGSSWPVATDVDDNDESGGRAATWSSSPGVHRSGGAGYPGSSSSAQRTAPDITGAEPPGGLLDLVAQLSQQLANETLRRDAEVAELEERRRDEARLRAELQAKRQRRADVLLAAEGAARASEETQRQHAELAEAHERTKCEVAKHEAELTELREAARARSGRDWARDGPEKDALVETKLSIAEAHDRLAHVQLQLRLNRDGLRRQLTSLQTENSRLRESQSSSAARA